MERTVHLERQAERVRFGCTAVLPGMLQTPEYARALVDELPALWDQDLGSRAAALGRPVDLTRRPLGQATVSVVLDGDILTSAKGRPHIMGPQIARLRRAADMGAVVIRVLPQAGRIVPGYHICELTLPVRSCRPTVLSVRETPYGAHYASDPDRVRDLTAVLDELEEAADTPARSLERLAEAEAGLRAAAALPVGGGRGW